MSVDLLTSWGSGESGFGAFNNTTMFDNITLTCLASNIQGPVNPTYSVTLYTIVRALRCLHLILVFLVGVFLNALIIGLVSKHKKLQNLSFGIGLVIVSTNLILSSINLLRLTNALSNRWVFGEHVCYLTGFIFFVVPNVRTAMLVIFVIDRFFLVFCPYTYPKYENKVVVILSIVPLVLFVLFGMTAYVLDCYTFIPTSWGCSASSGCHKSCSILFAVVFVSFIAPSTIIPAILYIVLFIKVKKIKKLDAAERPKHDWKATITFFLMFITTFALTLPTTVILFAVDAIYKRESQPATVQIFVTIAASVTLSLLPITDAVVILRNRAVIDVLKEIKEKIAVKCCLPKE